MKKNDKFIVWGLKTKKHSHRHIHYGFYRNLIDMGYASKWLDDSNSINESSIRNSKILVSGMASRYFPIHSSNSYIFHNFEPTEEQRIALEKEKPNFLKLQVFTKSSNGAVIDNLKNVLYDEKSNTLYQPWGTPIRENSWKRSVPNNYSNFEYWIGSIWNNSLGQGNSDVIANYVKVLKSFGIKFRRINRSRWSLAGISEEKASNFIYRSRIAATIVGNWQRENYYYPCRLFKNLSSGRPIVSNLNAQEVFGSSCLFDKDLSTLIETSINESFVAKTDRLLDAQNILREFTYEAAIKRIISVL